MDADARTPHAPVQQSQVDDAIAEHLERVEDELLHGKRSHADGDLPENHDREADGGVEVPAGEPLPDGDDDGVPPYPPVE